MSAERLRPASPAAGQEAAAHGEIERMRELDRPQCTGADPGDAPTPVRDAPADFVPIVGIGASAGGLEAFTQVLAHLPADTGLAYVLVQHLAPAHESLLAELLGRQATIPVTQVSDGLRVAPDHAYVIPPNTSMTVADGLLGLTPREQARHPPMPVDDFFRSLAETSGHRAMGVVLSGTGADGEQGVRAIKAAGGITFAEAPESAQHDSMPRAAIATGCVDFVLPPAEIAAQLARLSHYPYVRECDAEPAEPDAEPAVAAAASATPELPREIFHLLKARSGVDFSQYKRGTLTRRLRRRMLLRHVDTLSEYVELLQREPAEIDSLGRDLFICVTSFFRDPKAFEALVRVGFPAMRKDRAPGAPVRVWVPGCATGEEAYSIAMCLLEYLGDDARATPPQLFATDVSGAAIATARSGRYPTSIDADVSPERLARFFVKEEHGYRVSEAVRSLCVFAVQNVTNDPPFSHLDVVSCRNVLIYLQPALQTKVLSLFHYALAPTGILFLGTAESVSPSPGLFTTLDTANRIYTRTAAPRRAPALGAPSSAGATPPAPKHTEGGRRESVFLELEREADQIVLAHYASAGVVIDQDLEIVQFRGATSAYLEPAPGAASFQLLKMIRPELRTELHEAIRSARGRAAPAHAEGVPFHDGGALRHADIDVLPFKVVGAKGPFFVVLFEPAGSVGVASKARRKRGRPSAREASNRETRVVGELQQELAAMERHLRVTADEHEAALEELRAANEEIQSSNEEYRSTNEELETAKEELQSANEELTTLNAELRDRNTDLGALNDDLVNLLASIQVPVIIVGRDLRIRRYTAGAERLVNVIPADVGRPLSDIRPNIDVPDLVAMVHRVMQTLDVVEREVRDDQGHWYALRIRPYKTARERIDGAVLVFQDIDERKRHALALDEARRYAEAIVDTAREPLVVLDDALHVERANRAFYETFHVNPSETEGQPLFALGDGLWNIPRLRALLEEVLPAQASVDHFEVEHTFRGIGRKIMLLSARELHINHGHARLVLLAIEDMTQERQLVHRAHFLAEAGVVLGASVDYDAVLHQITELAVPELADWCIVDVVSHEDDAAGRVHRAAVAGPDPVETERVRQLPMPAATEPAHPVSRVLETGEPLLVEKVQSAVATALVGDRGAPGRRRTTLTPQSAMIVPLVASGRTLGTLTLLATGSERRYAPTDLTLAEDFAHRAALALEKAMLYSEAETARTAADAANKAKTEFLATMSHELRTPLNAISGYAELLEMEIYGPVTDAQRAALGRITRSEQHLLGLINAVLNFAKLEAGQVALATEDVNAADLLAGVDDMIAPQMAGKRLHYQAGACDPALMIRADPEKARQILLNLLTNAIKFTDAGGSIRTECEATDQHVAIRIHDTGRGIQADRLEAIFEPFMQVNPSLSSPSTGVGLGLAISRELAHAMGGDLTVESHVESGSTFTLSLPRIASGDGPPQERGERNARA